MDKSVALAAMAAFLFGSAMVVSKVGFRYTSPAVGASISIPSTAVMMWCLTPFLLDIEHFKLISAITFAIVGLVFPAVVTWLTFIATDRVGPTITNSISSTAPMFAIGCAIAFLGEPLTWSRAMGVTLITLGIFVFSWQTESGRRQWPLWLVVLPLLASAIRGGALTLAKFGLNLWPNPFAASLIGYTMSSAVMISVGLSTSHRSHGGDRGKALPWFAVVGLLNGTAVLTMYWALNSGDVGIVSPIVAISPLFTLSISGLLKLERVDWLTVSGVLIVLAGVVVLLR
jgi:drug/metabolite transporter (DMT)-like permease